MKKFNVVIVALLIVSMMCSSCKMFATQKVIDNIIPDHNKRMYTVADLIPYKYDEIKNAMALYGMQLKDYFTKNTSTKSELKRVKQEEKMKFYSELMMRTHNYKVIKQRFSMYVDEEGKESSSKEEQRTKEYNDYYAAQNAKSMGIIKQYNGGKAAGLPLMSIRAILATATESNVKDIYSEVDCEIFKPVVIDEKKYKSLKFGDTITLSVPATDSDIHSTETVKKTYTYVATDSLVYKSESGKNEYCFIAESDGINHVRRVLDYYGKTLEVYVETKPLQFLKYCRVANANDQKRLLLSMINEEFVEYDMSDIIERALCGGYINYAYKDYVYGNYIVTNPKGYITAIVDLNNQRIDNKYYRTIIDG